MSLIGLDIGTSACKAILFDEEGAILGQAAREYPIATPQPGWAEQDAEQVWRLALACLGEIAAAARTDAPQALALSVQGEAVIAVDAHNRPLRPAILGMDTRTVAENDWLSERFGGEALYTRTGMPLHTINTLPKLLWLRRHEPETWARAARLLLYEDYILARLGATPTISHCLASRTQLYDLARGDWADDILATFDIAPERLATLAPADGGIVGAMSPTLRRELGLSREVALVSGGHDQACAALGSGVVQPGLAMVSTGAAEVVEVALSSPTLGEALREGNVSVYRHVAPGLFLAMTLNHSGGLLLRWFRDALCPAERDAAIAAGLDPYDALLAGAPEGPTPLLVLPHWAGSGTPWLDTRSKGAILGLTFDTDRATLAKAILEGLTFELRTNLDLLRHGGIAIDALHAVGGGARSPLWLSLKADICQVPLRVPQVTDAACLGAALLAGVGAGCYADVGEAVRRTVRMAQEVSPQARAVAEYAPRYALYRQVYPALAALHHAM